MGDLIQKAEDIIADLATHIQRPTRNIVHCFQPVSASKLLVAPFAVAAAAWNLPGSTKREAYYYSTAMASKVTVDVGRHFLVVVERAYERQPGKPTDRVLRARATRDSARRYSVPCLSAVSFSVKMRNLSFPNTIMMYLVNISMKFAACLETESK